jgi:hypothetical protein
VNIEETVDVSAFGVSSCPRNLASQVAKSRNDADRPSCGDAWRKSEDSGKVPKRKGPSAHRDSVFREY